MIAYYTYWPYILKYKNSYTWKMVCWEGFLLSQNTFTPWVKLLLHLYDLVMLLYSESRFSSQSDPVKREVKSCCFQGISFTWILFRACFIMAFISFYRCIISSDNEILRKIKFRKNLGFLWIYMWGSVLRNCSKKGEKR